MPITLSPGQLSRSIGPLHINLDRQSYSLQMLQDFESSQENLRLRDFIDGLFRGDVVNPTEQRAAGHWSLRAAFRRHEYPDFVKLTVDGRDELELARTVQNHMNAFVEQVQSGQYSNPDGEPYESILHLGIGGSDLGPRLLHDVFSKLELTGVAGRLNIRFVANVDFHEMKAALAALNPKRTLVLIASKSFSTKETLHNAQHIFKWLDAAGPAYRQRALLAATCKPAKAAEFGIPPDRVFEFSETVGGRYSLWGPVSISIRLVHGNAVFDELLAGAALMDNHVLNTRSIECVPILLALSDFYNLKVGIDSLLLSPYDSRLGMLIPYLQQLWMESLGKGVSIDGVPIPRSTCPVLWGDVGTNGQHAFFQLMHQGRNASTVELVAILKPNHDETPSHRILLSHALAQAEAFSVGRLNSPQEMADPTVNYKSCPGQRPVQMVFLDELTPYSLGALLSLWEHRTCALGAMQNINPFDQWGVELGKVIAEQIEPNLPPGENRAENPITAHLIDHFINRGR